MSTHRSIDRVCCVILVLTLLLTAVLLWAAGTGRIADASTDMAYEEKLFDNSVVHTIDIEMEDWDAFLDTCENEEYAQCDIVIDGEAYSEIAIRAKGNTSLSSVKSYGNDRYSFKLEFDHYENGKTYYGLDKLSLNNCIQDNTYMKDYLTYQMMNAFGVDAPLCSFISVSVNGEYWGLYLAVEGVEESFLQRNYGSDYGELYKPDSMSFGGGRGNAPGEDEMEEILGELGLDFDADSGQPQEAGDENSGGSEGVAAGEDTDQPSATSGAAGNTPEQTAPAAGGAAGGDQSVIPAFAPGQESDSEMPADESVEGTDSSGTPGNGDRDFADAPEDGDQSSGGAQEGGGRGFGGAPEGRDQGFGGAQEGGASDFSSGFKPGGGFPGSMGADDVALIYTDENYDSYSNIFDNAKTDITDADKDRLIESLKQLNEGANIEDVVDIEEVIRYFVVHNFVCNGDSYTGTMIHNYYLYEEDGRLSMIPWDYNLAFGGFEGGADATSLVNNPIDSPVSGGDVESRPMIAWIFADDTYTELYHQYFLKFIAEYFDSGYFGEMFDSTVALISPYVQEDPTAFCTYEEFQQGTETLKQFCLLRAESVKGQAEGSIPSDEEGQSEDSSAFIDASGLSISDMGSMNGAGGMGRMGRMDGGRLNGGTETEDATGTSEDENGAEASSAGSGLTATAPAENMNEDPESAVAAKAKSDGTGNEDGTGDKTGGTIGNETGNTARDGSGNAAGDGSGNETGDAAGNGSGNAAGDVTGNSSGNEIENENAAPDGEAEGGSEGNSDAAFRGAPEMPGGGFETSSAADAGSGVSFENLLLLALTVLILAAAIAIAAKYRRR